MNLDELIIMILLIILAFVIGFAKGSEVTTHNIRRKFYLKKDYSYNDFMNVIDDN